MIGLPDVNVARGNTCVVICCDCLFVCLFVCERDGGLCTERVVEGITTKAAGCGYAITNGVKSVMGVTKM